MITEILERLNKTGTYETSKRLKRTVENIPKTEKVNAVDYGRRLSFLSEMDLVDKGDTQTNKWKINEKGKKWLDNELDLRDL